MASVSLDLNRLKIFLRNVSSKAQYGLGLVLGATPKLQICEQTVQNKCPALKGVPPASVLQGFKCKSNQNKKVVAVMKVDLVLAVQLSFRI